jgi:hypothetical protein
VHERAESGSVMNNFCGAEPSGVHHGADVGLLRDL